MSMTAAKAAAILHYVGEQRIDAAHVRQLYLDSPQHILPIVGSWYLRPTAECPRPQACPLTMLLIEKLGRNEAFALLRAKIGEDGCLADRAVADALGLHPDYVEAFVDGSMVRPRWSPDKPAKMSVEAFEVATARIFTGHADGVEFARYALAAVQEAAEPGR